MKKLALALLVVSSFQAAHADNQDIFPIDALGEDSVFRIEKDIIIPATVDSMQVYNVNEMEPFKKDGEYKVASLISGCQFVMANTSKRARIIPAGTEFLIEDVDNNNNEYSIKVKHASISDIICESGLGTSDNDATKKVTNREILTDEFSIEEEEITIADFNQRMQGLFSVKASAPVNFGEDDSDRSESVEVEGSSEQSAEQASAVQG